MAVVLIGIVLFSFLCATFVLENLDAEKAGAGSQLRLYVLSNTENFEMHNDKALRRAAWNVIRTAATTVSHIAVFGPSGDPIFLLTSPEYGAADTDLIEELQTIQTTARLSMPTSGSDLFPMSLPDGRVIYRSFTPVRKGPVKLGEVEMGFFRSALLSSSFKRLQMPASVAVCCVLVLMLICIMFMRRWERTRTGEVTSIVQGQVEMLKADFDRKQQELKKERETKDVDGGSFFNILEAVRDISASPDLPMFVRRSVLSSVRLFRCRLVSFYLQRGAEGQPPAWQLMGRYDGKGYAHNVQETLDTEPHPKLREALQVGATELLHGYPTDSTQSLIIAVAAEKPLGVIVLQNKVGSFDAKDLLAARVFAGFLPNLLAWHLK